MDHSDQHLEAKLRLRWCSLGRRDLRLWRFNPRSIVTIVWTKLASESPTPPPPTTVDFYQTQPIWRSLISYHYFFFHFTFTTTPAWIDVGSRQRCHVTTWKSDYRNVYFNKCSATLYILPFAQFTVTALKKMHASHIEGILPKLDVASKLWRMQTV